MIELPQEMRDILAEQLEEFLEESLDGLDAETLVQSMLDLLQEVTEEYGLEQADDIIGYLENSGDLDAPLLDVLIEDLENEDLLQLDAEELLTTLEKMCEIEWLDVDEGLFGVDQLDVDGDLVFEDELEEDEL